MYVIEMYEMYMCQAALEMLSEVVLSLPLAGRRRAGDSASRDLVPSISVFI